LTGIDQQKYSKNLIFIILNINLTKVSSTKILEKKNEKVDLDRTKDVIFDVFSLSHLYFY